MKALLIAIAQSNTHQELTDLEPWLDKWSDSDHGYELESAWRKRWNELKG